MSNIAIRHAQAEKEGKFRTYYCLMCIEPERIDGKAFYKGEEVLYEHTRVKSFTCCMCHKQVKSIYVPLTQHWKWGDPQP